MDSFHWVEEMHVRRANRLLEFKVFDDIFTRILLNNKINIFSRTVIGKPADNLLFDEGV